MVAVVSTLAYNAFLLYHERANVLDKHIATTPHIDTNTPTGGMFTLTQVAAHATPQDCWMAAFGNVYDLTTYVTASEHPDGQASLISGCGQEITDTFDKIHSEQAKAYLQAYKIGTLSN